MNELDYIDWAIIGFCLVGFIILEVAIYRRKKIPFIRKRRYGCNSKW